MDAIFSEGVAQRVWAQALIAQNPTRGDATEAHLAESLRLFEAGHARLEAAYTHVVWGNLRRECADPDSAREHFEKAAAQFQASGLTSELEQMKHMIDSLPS